MLNTGPSVLGALRCRMLHRVRFLALRGELVGEVWFATCTVWFAAGCSVCFDVEGELILEAVMWNRALIHVLGKHLPFIKDLEMDFT